MEAVMPQAQANKERQHEAGLQLAPTLLAMRGQDVVAQVTIAGDMRMIAGAIAAAAVGFDADMLVFIAESYTTELEDNPVTGKRWCRGEISDVATNHAGVELGWIREQMMVTAVNRAGDSGVATATFVATSDGVTWEPAEITDSITGEAGDWSGMVVEVLREVMERPSASVNVPDAGMTRAQQDLFTAQIIMQTNANCEVALYAGIEEENRIAELGEHGEVIHRGPIHGPIQASEE